MLSIFRAQYNNWHVVGAHLMHMEWINDELAQAEKCIFDGAFVFGSVIPFPRSEDRIGDLPS